MMKHTDYTFTVKARDVPGVLVRMTQVFARRGCNIVSLSVRDEKTGPWSAIDIEAYDVERPEQIELQLKKLIEVYDVSTSKRTIDDKKT